MSATEVLGMLAAIAAVAAIVYGCARWALRFHATERAHAADVDRILEGVARELGLDFTPGTEQAHPVVGSIRGFGEMRGEYRGRHVAVTVGSDSAGEGREDFTRVLVVSHGAAWPAVRGRKLDGLPAPLRPRVAELRGRCAQLEIEPTRVTAIPAAAWPLLGVRPPALLLDPAAIRRFVDDIIDLCGDLSQTDRDPQPALHPTRSSPP